MEASKDKNKGKGKGEAERGTRVPAGRKRKASEAAMEGNGKLNRDKLKLKWRQTTSAVLMVSSLSLP